MLRKHEEQEERKRAALEKHQRLSRLFREDRLAFERERRRMIQEVIDRAGNADLKGKLMDFQVKWDKRMRGAASENNRFVLAQSFFWEHFHNQWEPAVIRLRDLLNREKDSY